MPVYKYRDGWRVQVRKRYARDRALDPLIEFMFPQTWAVLSRWLNDPGIARLLG